MHLFPWDKADHFASFFAITTAAIVSFPRQPLWRIALVVSAAGGGIELVQALPIVGRDCDVRDWIADNIAIGAVLGLVLCARARWWLAAGESP
ncbi:MAG TPA: hypothetical protein VHZ26_19440 [Caulobacteraceae bacterium]|nr:hypothetical protein [Caulobacteraceae bacterium]